MDMSDDGYRMDCKAKKCTVYKGANTGLDIKEGECEVRKDVMIKKAECVRIWGQVKDCWGCPVEGALVKLVKEVYKGRKSWFVGIAHTLTDCHGFYQFDLCRKEAKCNYRIIAGKASMDRRYYDALVRAEEEENRRNAPMDETDEGADASGEDTEMPGDGEQAEEEADESAVDDADYPPEDEMAMQVEEESEAAEDEGGEEGSDDDAGEFPYRSRGEDKFDPDEKLSDDAYDKDYDPCRYMMKD